MLGLKLVSWQPVYEYFYVLIPCGNHEQQIKYLFIFVQGICVSHCILLQIRLTIQP